MKVRDFAHIPAKPGDFAEQIFLSNCTIWVEGITDRIYLKKYLEVYQKYLLDNDKIKTAYLEDSHFSFIEYGGSNIVHWSFIEDDETFKKIKTSRISTKIFLVADEDNTPEKPTSKKAKRLIELKEKLGNNFLKVDGERLKTL